MAEEIVKTIGSGGDFSTIVEFANYVRNDISDLTAIQTIVHGKLIDNKAYSDIGSFYNITCNDSYYIKLSTAEWCRHNGQPGSGAKILGSGATAGLLDFLDICIKIEGIEFDINDTNNNGIYSNDAGNKISLDRCIIYNQSTAGSNGEHGIFIANGALLKVSNCIIYNLHRSGANAVYGVRTISANVQVILINNVIYNLSSESSAGKGIYIEACASGSIAKGNIVGAVSGTVSVKDFHVLSGNMIEDYNISEDNTASGSNSHTNIEPGAVMENPDDGDFFPIHDSVAHRNGVYLGNTYDEAKYDINGIVRDSDYSDIGIFQYISKRRRIIEAFKWHIWQIRKYNGYNNDLGHNSLLFRTIDEISPDDFPAISYITGGSQITPLTDNKYTSGSGQFTTDGWLIGVLAYLETEKDVTGKGNITIEIEKIVEDIISAMSVDVTLGLKFVRNNYLSSVEPYIDIEDLTKGAVQVIYEVKYDFRKDRP